MIISKISKNLRLLLILMGLMTSMTKIQVNATNYVDGRFITNNEAIKVIVDTRATKEVLNLFNSVNMGNIMADASRIIFTIVTNPNETVKYIAFRVLVMNATTKYTLSEVLISAEPEKNMTIREAAILFRSNCEFKKNLFKFDKIKFGDYPGSIVPNRYNVLTNTYEDNCTNLLKDPNYVHPFKPYIVALNYQNILIQTISITEINKNLPFQHKINSKFSNF